MLISISGIKAVIRSDTQAGRRGAPAKGVGGRPRPGSNPGHSATRHIRAYLAPFLRDLGLGHVFLYTLPCPRT